MAAAAAVELATQRATSESIFPIYYAMGGAPYQKEKKEEEEMLVQSVQFSEEEKDSKFPYSLVDIALLLSYDPQTKEFPTGFTHKYQFCALLATAAFGELVIRGIVDILPTKIGIIDKSHNGDVHLNVNKLKDLNLGIGLAKEALEIMQDHKKVESVVGWCRNLSDCIPFHKGIKDIIHKAVQESTQHGVITETTVHKGIISNSTYYTMDETTRSKVITLIRSFALEGYTPKSVKEVAIVALFWAFDLLGKQLLSHTMSSDIIPKDKTNDARKNMKEFFTKTYSISA